MSQLELRVELVDLDELSVALSPRNPKRHALGALDASMERFGYTSPVLRNERDGMVAAGQGRVEMLLALRARGSAPPAGVELRDGRWLVPVIRGLDLAPVDADAYRIADNRTVELGGWDPVMLAEVLADLDQAASGLDGIGFTVAEMEELVASLEAVDAHARPDPDGAPALPSDDDLYVSRGELWQLGPHLLTCGDATAGEDVDRLLGLRLADVAFTDPPYNVRYGRHGGGGRGRQGFANDALSPKQWELFARGWARQLVTRVRGAIYLCMSSKEWPIVCQVMEETGGHWSDTLIWAKDRFVLGRADYHRAYEPIWYGWSSQRRRQWHGGRSESDLWQIPRPAAANLHPTMKPVELVERALRNSSRPGEIVLDLFCGSGTTVVAAERQGRRCRAVEIDPRYVQVAIERWQALTGRRAKRLEPAP